MLRPIRGVQALPASWFTTVNNGTVTRHVDVTAVAPRLGVTSISSTRILIHGRKDPPLRGVIQARLPARNLVQGEEFDVLVSSHLDIPLRGLQFVATVEGAPAVATRGRAPVELLGIHRLEHGWQGTTRTLNQSTTLFGSATRPSVTSLFGIAKAEEIFAIRARVAETAEAGSFLIKIAFSRGIDGLSAPLCITTAVADRLEGAAIRDNGRIYVSKPAEGVFITAAATELVNRAVIDGSRIALPLRFWSVRASGIAEEPASAFDCVSDTTVVQAQGCGLQLTGSETRGGNRTLITARHRTWTEARAAQRAKVWYPRRHTGGNLAVIRADNGHLRQVRRWYDCAGRIQYQRTGFTATVTFEMGLASFEAEVEIPEYRISDSRAARLVEHTALFSGSMVQGRRNGSVTVAAHDHNGASIGSTVVHMFEDTAANGDRGTPVIPACLSVTPFQGVRSVRVASPVNAGVASAIEVRIDQGAMRRVGDATHFVGSVMFSDYSRMELLAHELTVTSLAPASLAAETVGGQARATVIEPGVSVVGDTVEAQWSTQRSSGGCSTNDDLEGDDSVGSGDMDNPVMTTAVAVEVDVRSAFEIEVNLRPVNAAAVPLGLSADPPFLVYDEPATRAVGEVHEASLELLLKFTDGRSVDISASALVDVAVAAASTEVAAGVISLHRAADGSRTVSTGDSHTDQTISFVVTYNNAVTREFRVQAARFSDITIQSAHWPCRSVSAPTMATALAPLAASSRRIFQTAELSFEMVLTNGAILPIDDPGLPSLLFDGSTAVPDGWDTGDSPRRIWPLAANRQVVLSAEIAGSRSRSSLTISSSGTEVYVVGVSDVVVHASVDHCSAEPLGSAADFCGARGVTSGLLSFTAALSDGTVCQAVRMGQSAASAISGCRGPRWEQVLPSTMFQFRSSVPSAISVGDSSGVIALQGNHESTVTVQVSGRGDMCTGESCAVHLAANTDPSLAGDFDFGAECGIPLEPRDASEEFEVPVRMNTGNASVLGFVIEIRYDSAVIDLADVDAADAVTDRAAFASLSITRVPPPSGSADAETVIVIAGVFKAGAAKRGSAAHVLQLRFRADAQPPEHRWTVLRGRLLEMIDTGYRSVGQWGSTFVAGDVVQTTVGGRRRARRQEHENAEDTPVITCGAEIRAVIAAENESVAYVLDLSNENGNTQVNLNTCGSAAADPDLCVATEYMDDGRASVSASESTTCDSRQHYQSGSVHGDHAEDTTFVLAPGVYPLRLGTFSGVGEVVLRIDCAMTNMSSTPLRLDPELCLGPQMGQAIRVLPTGNNGECHDVHGGGQTCLASAPVSFEGWSSRFCEAAFEDNDAADNQACSLAQNCVPGSSPQQRGDVDGDCCHTIADVAAVSTAVNLAVIYAQQGLWTMQASGRDEWRTFCEDLRTASRVWSTIHASSDSRQWADADNNGIVLELDDVQALTEIASHAGMLLDSPVGTPVSPSSQCQMHLRVGASSAQGGSVQDDSLGVVFRMSFSELPNVLYTPAPNVSVDAQVHLGSLIDSACNDETAVLAVRSGDDFVASFSVGFGLAAVRVTADVVALRAFDGELAIGEVIRAQHVGTIFDNQVSSLSCWTPCDPVLQLVLLEASRTSPPVCVDRSTTATTTGTTTPTSTQTTTASAALAEPPAWMIADVAEDAAEAGFPAWFFLILFGGVVLVGCFGVVFFNRFGQADLLPMPEIRCDNPNADTAEVYFIESDEAGQIFMTMDGTPPDPKNPEHRYIGSRRLLFSAPNIQVRAIAHLGATFSMDAVSSPEASRVFEAPVDATPPMISQLRYGTLNITAAFGDIFFTSDGSDPIAGFPGHQYDPSKPLVLDTRHAHDVQIRAVAFLKLRPPSAMTTMTFHVLNVPAPTISRHFNGEVHIAAQEGALLKYTAWNAASKIVQGSETTRAILAPEIVSGLGATIISVQAFQEGWAPSTIVRETLMLHESSRVTIVVDAHPSKEGGYPVTLECATPGVSIWYQLRHRSQLTEQPRLTVDGMCARMKYDPSDRPVVAPSFDDPVMIEAFACRGGFAPSTVSCLEHKVSRQVMSPQITIDPNDPDDELIVTLHCGTPRATIEYSLNPDTEDEWWETYTGTFAIPVDGQTLDTEIRVQASKASMKPSAFSSMFLLDFDICAKPIIRAEWSERNPRGYILTILSATHDAVIHYSETRADQAVLGLAYNSHFRQQPVILPLFGEPAVVVHARATRTGLKPSELSDRIVLAADKQTPTPFIGTTVIDDETLEVDISCKTFPEAEFMYTLDGADVETHGKLYDPQNKPRIRPSDDTPAIISAMSTVAGAAPSRRASYVQHKERKVPTPKLNLVPLETDDIGASPRRSRVALPGNGVAMMVEMTCADMPDAIIKYTTNGTLVTAAGRRYYADNMPMIMPPFAGEKQMVLQVLFTHFSAL